MPTDKMIADAESKTQQNFNKIVNAMRNYGVPLTSVGVADEADLPFPFVRTILPRMVREGYLKYGPEDAELGTTYEVNE